MDVDVSIVSCNKCGAAALIGADQDDTLYFLCLICRVATPIESITDEIKKGVRLPRMRISSY